MALTRQYKFAYNLPIWRKFSGSGLIAVHICCGMKTGNVGACHNHKRMIFESITRILAKLMSTCRKNTLHAGFIWLTTVQRNTSTLYLYKYIYIFHFANINTIAIAKVHNAYILTCICICALIEQT